MQYNVKGYHLLGGEAVNLMMHEASDDHGTPVPGKPKVARFSFFPQSGAKAGHLAKNIQAWCSRNNIEPDKVRWSYPNHALPQRARREHSVAGYRESARS